jgi:alpha-tubulin suppressor-like RCC1 family protein
MKPAVIEIAASLHFCIFLNDKAKLWALGVNNQGQLAI